MERLFIFGVLFAVIPIFVCETGYFCVDPDTGSHHEVNSTWPSTTFCGNYSCNIRDAHTYTILDADNKKETSIESSESMIDSNENADLKNVPIEEKSNSEEVTETTYEEQANPVTEDDPEIINKVQSNIVTEENPEITNKEPLNFITEEVPEIANGGKTKTFTATNVRRLGDVCQECDKYVPKPNDGVDRYLTREEVNNIAMFLRAVKKSDIDTLVKMYRIANSLYGEMDNSATEESPKFNGHEDVPSQINHLPIDFQSYSSDTDSYSSDKTPPNLNRRDYYDPSSLLPYTYMLPNVGTVNPKYYDYSQSYTTTQVPYTANLGQVQALINEKDRGFSMLADILQQSRSGTPDLNTIQSERPRVVQYAGIQANPNQNLKPAGMYVYPYTFYQEMPSLLQSTNLKYVESNAARTSSPVVFKFGPGSEEETVFTEYSGKIQNEPTSIHQTSVQNLPYPVSGYAPFNVRAIENPAFNNRIPVNPYATTNNLPQNSINPQQLSPQSYIRNQYVPLARDVIRKAAPLQFIDLRNTYKRISETDMNPKDHIKLRTENSVNNNVGNMLNQFAWRTPPLSQETLESVRAHVTNKPDRKFARHIEKEDFTFNPFNGMTFQRVGKVNKLDDFRRMQRDLISGDKTITKGEKHAESRKLEINDIHAQKRQANRRIETYVTSITCNFETEPGFFRNGNSSMMYPHCCPTRLQDPDV